MRRERASFGFTLLEMLVVLAILALVTGVSVVMLRPPSQGLQLQAAVRKMCAQMRLARARAIASNEETSYAIDARGTTYRVLDLVPVALPAGTAVAVTFAANERHSVGEGVFRFYPTGEATGGDIRLVLGTATAHVVVNWLTGEAVCGE